MNKYSDREITKIVCFCACNRSHILEHLQNQDSYIVKLCRDPDTLEQAVDAIHPDVILIDCTGAPDNCAINSSYNVPSKTNIERIIELKEIVTPKDDATFYPDKAAAIPPIIFPSYLPEHLPIRSIVDKSEILFVFDSDPGVDVRLQCVANRCDVMVSPFLFEELNFKIKLHANQRELSWQINWHKETLNRAVAHIDKLKSIIFDTKAAWARENEILHNSLKQISIMSNDREALKRELHTSRVKLFENIKGINEFLCSMVESRNEHQKGHSKRVAQIAEFVAKTIGVGASSLKILKNAAMLHEVGMLLIPSSILNKRAVDFSEYEKNMMLHHPSNGAAYLEKCPGFEKVANIICHLHENSDGTGYPEGLKKRYIPLLSKILAGADVLDQIWVDNPYASIDRILELLEEQAGSRLDPSIVSILEKYVVTVLYFNPSANKTDIDHLEEKEDKEDNQPNVDPVNGHVRLKEIAIYQLKPGMVIGTGIFTKTGTKLLSSGTTLNEDSIRMVEKYSKEYPLDDTVFIKDFS
ncbi:MAG: HD domain-containing protein [Desulfamplus sp.]|nr:HD domain-containing protein [Desulfamplus sp.]